MLLFSVCSFIEGRQRWLDLRNIQEKLLEWIELM